MLVSYETAVLLKQAGWPQDHKTDQFWVLKNGKWERIPAPYFFPPEHDDQIDAPEALDVLEGEWLRLKGWRWRHEGNPGMGWEAWCILGIDDIPYGQDYDMKHCKADSADELIAAICRTA